MPAGTATSASRPTITAAAARGLRARGRLLLDVRTTNGCGWDGTTDHARDRDQRQQVRKSLEQRAVDGPAVDVLELRGQSGREAEQERGRESSGRTPVTEDERRQGDEPASVGHLLVEVVREAD